jgi:hypothetical protein
LNRATVCAASRCSSDLYAASKRRHEPVTAARYCGDEARRAPVILESRPQISNLAIHDVALGNTVHPHNVSWSTTGSMTTARDLDTATLLPSGKVLVAGRFAAQGEIKKSALLAPTPQVISSGRVDKLAQGRDALESSEVLPQGSQLGLRVLVFVVGRYPSV